jgi:hypothetical protein
MKKVLSQILLSAALFCLVGSTAFAQTSATAVTVLSPNGGEQLQLGQSNTIRWSGGTEKVMIGLIDSRFEASPEQGILGWITVSGAPDGSVTWDGENVCGLDMTSCRDDLTSLSQGPYRILAISRTANGNYCPTPSQCNMDLSDRAFTISTNPSLPLPKRNIPTAGYEDTVLTNIQAYQNPFPDTDIAQLSGKAAAELYRRAVIGGFPDGQFKGGQNVNRAEAAKFLLLARFGTVADDVTNKGGYFFPDVLDGQWYTKFVITASAKGIINGYPDGNFRPANSVNTAEFLKMLSLTFGLQLNMTYSYSDVSSSDWFAQYAGIAQKYNLFPTRSSLLNPDLPLSRQDVAIAIYQYLVNR